MLGEIIVVVFPEHKPCFGLSSELIMLVGQSINVTVSGSGHVQFFQSIFADNERIKKGFTEFEKRHPGTTISYSGLGFYE